MNTLQTSTYEVRIPIDSGPSGESYLGTLLSYDGRRFTTPLRYDNGAIRGHTSYAVLKHKPLWVVSADRSFLSPEGEYQDLWSNAVDLPQYRGWGSQQFKTSIIIPFGTSSVGFLNLEFLSYFEPNRAAKEEFQEIAQSIEILHRLCKTHKNQTENTESAVSSINTRVSRSPLLKSRLFFAFSSHADWEVIGIIKEALSSYSESLEIISWDEMQSAGNIHAQMREAILTSEYGVCYFSQLGETDGSIVDNPNVIFEAGMFYALTSSLDGKSRWLPIREKSSHAPPFDFAADRLVNVQRNSNGAVNIQSLRAEIHKRLDALLA